MTLNTFNKPEKYLDEADLHLGMPEKLLKVSQAARYLNLRPEILRDYIREGLIRAYRLKKQYRIPESELRRFLEREGNRGGGTPGSRAATDHDSSEG